MKCTIIDPKLLSFSGTSLEAPLSHNHAPNFKGNALRIPSSTPTPNCIYFDMRE